MKSDPVANQETFQESNIGNNLKELLASIFMNISMLYPLISGQILQNGKELNFDVRDKKVCKMGTILYY